MSAIGIPISLQAAALRIIGATMSRPRSSACTGPTVVASSPVPRHALESTPVRTQRFSSMSERPAPALDRASNRRIPAGRMRGTASRHSGCAPAHNLPALLEHLAVLHDEVDVFQGLDVVEGIALHRDQVGALAGGA